MPSEESPVELLTRLKKNTDQRAMLMESLERVRLEARGIPVMAGYLIERMSAVELRRRRRDPQFQSWWISHGQPKKLGIKVTSWGEDDVCETETMDPPIILDDPQQLKPVPVRWRE